MSRIVIFANGDIPDPHAARNLLQEGDYIIAADGGARHLLAMGILPNIVVGDLDSIGEDTLHELTNAEVDVKQYPTDKDETDLELALGYALELRPSAVLIAGALGSRLDQSLAGLILLASPSLGQIDVRLDDGVEEVFFCRGQAEVRGRSGELVSLIPWGGVVDGVVTEGLRWSLHAEMLFPDKTRGLSNEMIAEKATVKVKSGLLLIVHRRSSE